MRIDLRPASDKDRPRPFIESWDRVSRDNLSPRVMTGIEFGLVSLPVKPNRTGRAVMGHPWLHP